MKQSSIEWMVKQLNDKVDFIPLNKWDEIRDLVEQAKEMEKEQIIDAYATAVMNENNGDYIGTNEQTSGEIYYNETFNTNEK